MTKPVVDTADIELEHRPAALSPSCPAAERLDDGKPQRFAFVGRESDSSNCREGE